MVFDGIHGFFSVVVSACLVISVFITGGRYPFVDDWNWDDVLSLLLIMLITLITIVFELSFWIVIVRFVTDDVDVVDSIGTSLFVVGDDGKVYGRKVYGGRVYGPKVYGWKVYGWKVYGQTGGGYWFDINLDVIGIRFRPIFEDCLWWWNG